MHDKIYGAIGKDLPKVIREVVGKALMSFQDGKATRAEVNDVLQKNFSDKTFDRILQCAQGNLDMCKQIKLENWKENAEKHIAKKANVIQTRTRAERDKKRDELMKKMEKIYDAQAKMTHEERKEQRKIEREANLLAKEIVNAKDMTAAEKKDAFTALKQQANDKIYEIFGKTGHEACAEVSALVDFKNTASGGTVVKAPQPKNFSEINVSS